VRKLSRDLDPKTNPKRGEKGDSQEEHRTEGKGRRITDGGEERKPICVDEEKRCEKKIVAKGLAEEARGTQVGTRTVPRANTLEPKFNGGVQHELTKRNVRKEGKKKEKRTVNPSKGKLALGFKLA